MNRRYLSIFLVLILAAAAAPAAASGGDKLRRYAVIIGANNGGAGSDAEAVARVLRELGGVRQGDALLVRDPDARRIDQTFATVSKRIKSERVRGQRVELL